MYKELQARATGLCIAIPVAIIVLGRFFGGSLWGLIPLAACVASGVWLWVQEVIRSGKEMEWSSETLRGQTVCFLSISTLSPLFLANTFYRLQQTFFPNPSNG